MDEDALNKPVNKFLNGRWIFQEDLEDIISVKETSLLSYTLFKFLINSNLIYSLKEIETTSQQTLNEMQRDLDYLIKSYNICSDIQFKPIRFRIKSISMFNEIIKEIDYEEFANLNKFSFHDTCSEKDDESITDSISVDSEGKITHEEVINQLNKFLKNQNKNKSINISKLLQNSAYKVSLFFFNSILFDFEVELLNDNQQKHEYYKIIDNELDYCLEREFESSILGKTLEKGTRVNKITYANYYDEDIEDVSPILNISFSLNTLKHSCHYFDSL